MTRLEPIGAESICLDILAADNGNVDARLAHVRAITD